MQGTIKLVGLRESTLNVTERKQKKICIDDYTVQVSKHQVSKNIRLVNIRLVKIKTGISVVHGANTQLEVKYLTKREICSQRDFENGST